jgi:uncharacterized small protein (TIGR04563 family)
MANDSRKQSVYLPAPVLEDIQQEARRQDRSVSWLLQAAWKIAAPKFRELPEPPRR